ncbi:MAG: hypothetical protein VB067_11910 [Christensenellaceae bacterium]|nr:hypothetical protein [Christensenellaceae bacterium]MEA5069688.1 hypothetical protein [Christensenellaceae bacterium]
MKKLLCALFILLLARTPALAEPAQAYDAPVSVEPESFEPEDPIPSPVKPDAPEPGIAEPDIAEPEYGEYQNERDGYRIGFPAAWTLLSRQSIDHFLDALASGEVAIEGMDASKLAAYKRQIEDADMMLCIAPDASINVNVTYQQLPAHQSTATVKAMVPDMRAQYARLFPGYAPDGAPSVAVMGERAFVLAGGSYTLMGADILMEQALLCEGTTLYAITFTVNRSLAPDMDAFYAMKDAILQSFEPGKQISTDSTPPAADASIVPPS